MKYPITAIITVVLTVSTFAATTNAQAPEEGSPSANLQNLARNSFIFRFDDSISPAQARSRAAAAVSQAGGRLGYVYTNTIKGFSASMTSVAADNLFQRNADVIGYTRDGIASIVTSTQGNKNGKGGNPFNGGGSAGQKIPWGVTRVGGAGNGADKRACVIDTGVDLDHPDLKGNVDIAKSKSFVESGKSASSPDDFQGHGTHVAGTIAAIDNNIDVVGVAPGATIVSIRVLDQRGSGLWSWVIAGIDYTLQAGCDVANLSLGGGGNTAVDGAVEAAAEAGVKFAIAAGNSGADAKSYSPARAEHANIYTVSAIDNADVFAYFSNYGNPPIDYAAPGVGVLSLKMGGGTTTKSGTSMAAPHMAGLLLLVDPVTVNSYAKNDPDGEPDPIAGH